MNIHPINGVIFQRMQYITIALIATHPPSGAYISQITVLLVFAVLHDYILSETIKKIKDQDIYILF